LTSPPEYTALAASKDGASSFRPLVFGETLFDHFPDGSRVLGGAPFNVAWHLRGFKGDPLMVTAVGKDREGQEILAHMGRWGMDTSGVQIHPSRPTGRVTAHLDGDQPRYDIEPRQAYDAVRIEQLPDPEALSEVSLLYHGTLAVREEMSSRALAYLNKTLDVPTFIDVNLRDPWWSVETTPDLLKDVAWVKASREEVEVLSGVTVSEPASLAE
jgi:fructokinase